MATERGTAERIQVHLAPAQLAEAKVTVLAARREGWSTQHCANLVGVGRRTIYSWTDADPNFAQAWADAYEGGSDWVEDRLRDQVERGIPVSTIVSLKMRRRFVEKEAADPEQLAQSILAAMRQIVAAQRTQLAPPATDVPGPTADTPLLSAAAHDTPR